MVPHYGMFENENNVGFMFLVEVALGKEKTELHGGNFTAAPKGYDSIVARGLTEPSKIYKFIHLCSSFLIFYSFVRS